MYIIKQDQKMYGGIQMTRGKMREVWNIIGRGPVIMFHDSSAAKEICEQLQGYDDSAKIVYRVILEEAK